jgi:hypothetical protein
MAEPPIGFFLPCAVCKTEVVASVAMLRSARGFKCPSCSRWTDVEPASVNALQTDYEPTIAELRRRLKQQS